MKFSKAQIKEAIARDYPHYVNNLRNRGEKIQKDCFVRGTLAEIFLRDFLKSYDFIVQSNISNNAEDIDLQISGLQFAEKNIAFDRPLNIEIKTSLIPYQSFDIYKSADLKIYKKTDDIQKDIVWDIGVQVYFNYYKKGWENFIELSDEKTIETMYHHLEFSIFWITKNKAIQYSNAIANEKDKIWTFPNSFKQFWKCPLKIHHANIDDLIVCLLKSLIFQKLIVQKKIHGQQDNFFKKIFG